MSFRPLLLALLVVLGVGSTARAEAPNIIVITVDTTRADRMGFLGSKRGLTPNLDTVARQGIVFERAYSQAPLTPVSHATIFTGTYPQFHTVTDFGHPLPELLPFIPEILKKSGYHTAAFIGSYVLGMGFTMEPDSALAMLERNPRNKEVLFPYLNGQDLNSRVDCSASRWVINFHDWNESKARTYPDLFEHVERLVKPEREKSSDKKQREQRCIFLHAGEIRGP